MKFFAIAALVATTSAVKLQHPFEYEMAAMEAENMYRPNVVQSPWAAKPGDAPARTKITDAFTVFDHLSSFYERKVPDHWTGAGDDKLMESIIAKYSLEGNTDGAPNGQFYVTKAGCEAIAKEVIGTHLHTTNAADAALFDQRFGKVYAHIDVLNEGFLDAGKVPQFLHMLDGEVETENGL